MGKIFDRAILDEWRGPKVAGLEILLCDVELSWIFDPFAFP